MSRFYSIQISVLIISILVITSCNIDDFGDMNTNPNSASKATPEYLFTRAQLDAVSENYVGGAYRTISQAMQQFSTYKEVPAAGDKYFNDGYSRGNWNQYQNALSTLQLVKEGVSEDPRDVNKLSIVRVWRVFIYSRLTDLYGDIPYSEAEEALSNDIFSPKYDKQSFIYNDMLNELDEAAQAFDSSKPTFGEGDLIYGGSVGQWKKFAYSMMLRLGMRLTEVDEQAAEKWVKKAIAGDVIKGDEDRAYIEYTNGSNTETRNFIANGLMLGDYLDPQDPDNIEGSKYAKTFIDYLKKTDDPRLNVWSVVWVESNSGQRVADTTTTLQKGMANAAYNKIPGNFDSFSEPNPNTILNYAAPYVVFTNAETYLLLAEASIRGWYAGNASEAYNNAVRAGMRQWALFGGAGEISTKEIDSYLANNPYNSMGTFEEQLNQIGTQKWVSLFVEDPYEIFANWRRTGYPELTPTDYPGNLTGGTIPIRFVVPESEELYNSKNFQEAKQRQGGNLFTTRVWWDKK